MKAQKPAKFVLWRYMRCALEHIGRIGRRAAAWTAALSRVLLRLEAQQYPAFLLLWYVLQASHGVVRLASLSLLFLAAGLQQLAAANLLLVQRVGLYSALGYILSSVLLLFLLPGSTALQAWQQRSWQDKQLRKKQKIGTISARKSKLYRLVCRIHLHYKLWLSLPLRWLWQCCELVLAVLCCVVFFVLANTNQFAVGNW